MVNVFTRFVQIQQPRDTFKCLFNHSGDLKKKKIGSFWITINH